MLVRLGAGDSGADRLLQSHDFIIFILDTAFPLFSNGGCLKSTGPILPADSRKQRTHPGKLAYLGLVARVRPWCVPVGLISVSA
jgi:hypothetical protein